MQVQQTPVQEPGYQTFIEYYFLLSGAVLNLTKNPGQKECLEQFSAILDQARQTFGTLPLELCAIFNIQAFGVHQMPEADHEWLTGDNLSFLTWCQKLSGVIHCIHRGDNIPAGTLEFHLRKATEAFGGTLPHQLRLIAEPFLASQTNTSA